MRLGFGEVVVVLALALLIFGPSKLPQLGSSLGQALKSFKKGLSSLHGDADAPEEEEQKALPAETADSGAQTTRAPASAGRKTS